MAALIALLALLTSVFFGGPGLADVGKPRLGVAAVAAVYGAVALFCWTRLVVSTPYGCWLVAGVLLLIVAATAIGAAVVAVRSPLVTVDAYNCWFFFLFSIFMVFAF